MELDIQLDPNNLGEAQEFVEGFKSCTREVIEFLRFNCESNDEALPLLIEKILHLTKDFERKLRTDSRPIRNLEVLDKVRRKILERQQNKNRRRILSTHERNSGQHGKENMWRPF